MMRRIFALLTLTLAASVYAADSVVIGSAISSSFYSKVACPAGFICLNGQYLWVLRPSRTVAGPLIKGQVRAISIQHMNATQQFISSAEIFVLRPIKAAPPLYRAAGADFYLVSLSSRDSAGHYCLSVDPATVGLHVAPSEIHRDGDSYCFDAQLL
jgi:hypothetical protein